MALSGKVAVVTGASSGIGKCIATTLAKAGAKVVLAARREENMALTVEDIRKDGGEAIAIKCDITSREQVQNLMQKTEQDVGPIDILVNNAGVAAVMRMMKLDYAETDKHINVNVHGPINCTAEVVNSMIKRKTGHIVFISSINGRKGYAAFSINTGCKFFQEGLALSLRKELAKDGIKVTVILPGVVKTEIVDHVFDVDPEAYDVIAAQYTLQQTLDPSDIANAVLYAVSQAPHVAVNEMFVTTTDEK